MVDCVLPHEPDIERSLLGSLMVTPGLLDEAVDRIREDHLYGEQHRAIWSAISQVHGAGGVPDVSLVAERLRADGGDQQGTEVYLAEMLDTVSTSRNLDRYLAILESHRLRRAAITIAANMQETAFCGDVDGVELLESAEGQIITTMDGTRSAAVRFHTPRSLMPAVIADLERARGGQITGIPTGIESLDQVTGGMQRADLIIIGGCPGTGKTSLAWQIAVHTAGVMGLPVGVLELEMSGEQMVQRSLAMESGISVASIRRGLTEEQYAALTQAVGRVETLPIHIDDSTSLSAPQIVTRARRLHRQYGIRLLVLDHLQITTPTTPGQPRKEHIGEVARTLKTVAKALDIPVVGISQLTKTASNRRPMTGDLMETGNIEASADVILLTHRPELYDADAPRGDAEIIVGKQRNGPTCKLSVDEGIVFDKTRTMFVVQKREKSSGNTNRNTDAEKYHDW